MKRNNSKITTYDFNIKFLVKKIDLNRQFMYSFDKCSLLFLCMQQLDIDYTNELYIKFNLKY